MNTINKIFVCLIILSLTLLFGCSSTSEDSSISNADPASIQSGNVHISGTLKDSNGNIISGGTLMVEGFANLNSIIKDDGYFDIYSIPKGTYSFSITYDNIKVYIAHNVQILESGIIDLGIERFSNSTGITLTGKVIDEGEHPIAGAKIFINQNNYILTTITSSDGSYTINNIPVGNVTQNIIKDQYNNSLKVIEIESGKSVNSTTVLIPKDGSAIPRYGNINGIVTSVDEVTPINGAMVIISGPTNVQQIAYNNFTSVNGEFSAKIYEGDYELTVTKNGYSPYFSKITISKDNELNEKIILNAQ